MSSAWSVIDASSLVLVIFTTENVLGTRWNKRGAKTDDRGMLPGNMIII